MEERVCRFELPLDSSDVAEMTMIDSWQGWLSGKAGICWQPLLSIRYPYSGEEWRLPLLIIMPPKSCCSLRVLVDN